VEVMPPPVDAGDYLVLDESRNWPLCGGNKIRKLARILQGVEVSGLLTFGSRY
jgi:hypothetical protein